MRSEAEGMMRDEVLRPAEVKRKGVGVREEPVTPEFQLYEQRVQKTDAESEKKQQNLNLIFFAPRFHLTKNIEPQNRKDGRDAVAPPDFLPLGVRASLIGDTDLVETEALVLLPHS